MLNGIVRRRPATLNKPMAQLKTCCKRKRRFLMDQIIRGRPEKTNQNLAPWTRKRWFLVDGKSREGKKYST